MSTRGRSNAGKAMWPYAAERYDSSVQLQHRLQRRVLCRLLFMLLLICPACVFAADASGHRKSSTLGRVTAPHTHRTAHPTHTLHNVPPWRRLAPFA